MHMKKLASLIVFVGLTFSISAQDQPTNLKEAVEMATASWLFGDWEREGSDGSTRNLSFKWAVKDAAISIHSTGGRGESHGIVGFDHEAGKVVGKSFSNGGHADSEWLFVDGKLIEKITMNGVQDGEPRQMTFARSIRRIDENNMEMAFHRVSDSGEVGQVVERNGTKLVQTWKRKK
jgi:hypothetical protein